MNKGFFGLTELHIILLDCVEPHSLLFSATVIKKALHDELGLDYEMNASDIVPPELVGITLRLDPRLKLNPQGYSINITSAGISVQAQDEAGIFYAACTLEQLIQYYASPARQSLDLPVGNLPCMEISDWPDYLNRGFMLDVSRDKVPTMETIYSLIDLLASWKVNQLQLYTEHTFAYQNHPLVWKDASPFTGEEILELDAYCRKRYIELVPNQNSFGHLEHWLVHPRYRGLAEAPEGFDLPREHHSGPFSLCPLDPSSIALVSSMYDELLPHFSSRQLNVGCDETFDLGLGRSREACDRLGTGRVYLDFLLKIYHDVTRRGYKMQFWGDIIMAHPDLVSEIPRDSIALDWGYEADDPFEEHGDLLSRVGVPFYVCPGTSSWNSIAGRTKNCIENISNAARSGLKYGAAGFLNTDWGDNGHWQVLPVSYLGMAVGAAFSWAYEANQGLDLPAVLDLYAFHDSAHQLGKIAYDLGNIYREVGIEPNNSSALFEILQHPIHQWKEYLELDDPGRVFPHILELIDQITGDLPHASPRRPNHELLQREFLLTANLLRHACQRGLYGYGLADNSPASLSHDLSAIIGEYKDIWLTRNRPGGLQDSLAYFDLALSDYR